MTTTRGAAALALLMLVGCDDDRCPGVGGPDGDGIITVVIGAEILGDCTPPVEAEIVPALITGDPSVCGHYVPSYSDSAQCEYNIESVCIDDLGAWAFALEDAMYAGDGRYEGVIGFSRADVDGNITCTSSYLVTIINR